MSELRIRDVMTTRPLCLPVSATVADAVSAARERDVHHVMMKRGHNFAGVVCMCTLLKHEQDATLHSCLPGRTHAVQAESPLWIARRRFEIDGMSCLPVFEGEDLVGVLTRGDLRRRAPQEAGAALHAQPCSFCGAERHVRPVAGQPGLFTCLGCSQQAGAADAVREANVGH